LHRSLGFLADPTDHRGKAVRAGRRKVPLQPGGFEDAEVGHENLSRRPTIQQPQNERDETPGDQGVAVGREVEVSVPQFRTDPDAGLAAGDGVLGPPEPRLEYAQISSQPDKILVPCREVLEVRHLGDHSVLHGVEGVPMIPVGAGVARRIG
jgi:hypothetical protein